MTGTLFSTPRPEPSHLLPAAGGAVVLVLALPVIALLGWSVAGWALAAAIWVGVHALDVVVARARATPGAAASGLQAFALFFKAVALLVVLFAALAANRDVALAAALTYALAYTCELGLSLVLYFGSPAR